MTRSASFRSALLLILFFSLITVKASAIANESITYGAADTYNNTAARAAFPQEWGQYGFNQRHNPVFAVSGTAPAFLSTGITTVSPLTGDEYQRVVAAQKYFPSDGRLAWGSTVAQWVGNVVGSSVVQGIVFTTTSRREIYASDAQTGLAIWRKELVGVAGMGQPLVQTIEGKLRVIVTAGDADFNAQNAVRAAAGLDFDRGAEFSAVYCFDALTGEQVWRFDTKGAARPTPLYRNGLLYLVNGDGHLYILDAGTGSLISTYTNPTKGQSGLSSPNFYLTPAGRLILYYGILNPRNILAVDVTNATAPTLAWAYAPPGASANAPGDVSVAVDTDAALVVTSVFTNTGTSTTPIYDERLIALNANTGQVIWSALGGQGANLDGFKSANPMIDNGSIYVGNPLNSTVQSYVLSTGALRWSTTLPSNDPSIRLAPRAAPVILNGQLIFPVGDHIFTFNSTTGAILNNYYHGSSNMAFSLNQPVVIGNIMYAAANSGYLFAFKVSDITTQPGPGAVPAAALALKTAEYYDASALPTSEQQNGFPTQSLAYAGGPDHNSCILAGPSVAQWSAAMPDALSLTGAPLDDNIFGTEIATQMTHLSLGAGAGVTAVSGIVYANSNNRYVLAYNATTGKLLWRFRTNNHNFGQPLATPNAVLVMGGNIGLNFGNNANYTNNSSQTRVGSGFMYIHALDPLNGNEKWTFYAGQGAMSSTPLYSNGVLYWVDGQSKVWAINADTGVPVAPFMDANGQPVLTLGGGFNAISSANLFTDTNGRRLMVVGMSMPNRAVAIDLATAAVAWTQTLSGFSIHNTGLSVTSPAIDQTHGLAVSSALVNVNQTANTAQVLVYALNASTGALVWTQSLEAGPITSGFVAPTPMVGNNRVYLTNPTENQVVSLDAVSGSVLWQTEVASTGGKHSWAPPTLVGTDKLIVPMGGNIYTFDPNTGALLKSYTVGGAHTFNHVSVLGGSTFIGNSYGWVMSVPLITVAGN